MTDYSEFLQPKNSDIDLKNVLNRKLWSKLHDLSFWDMSRPLGAMSCRFTP